MRPLLRSVVAVAAAGVTLTACNDQSSPGPVAPRIPRAASPAIVFQPVCDFTALKSNTKAYAVSNRDELYTIISDLQKAYGKAANPAATNKAFDGLARLALMRGNPDYQKTTATGTVFNALTRGFIGCMESYITNTLTDDFSVQDALKSGWMYEVRGGTTDASEGAYERGKYPDAYWAAEAPSTWGASISATSQAKRFLIYGFRTNTFSIPTGDDVASSFETRTVPAIGAPVLSLSSPLHIGLCNYTPAPTVRVQHNSDVLTKQDLTCSQPANFTASALAAGRFAPSVLAQRAFGFFAPRTAYAAMFFGGVGGAVSELSPSAVIDIGAVMLTFVDGVGNGQVSLPMTDSLGGPLRVLAATEGGTPLSGVTVTLEIYGNSSSIAFFREGTSTTTTTYVTRTTGPNGVATFGLGTADNPYVYLTKAGGYQLVATGTFDSGANAITSNPFVSNSFNYQNK